MLRLINPLRQDIQTVEAQARVNPDAVYLIIPEQVRNHLQLEQHGTRTVAQLNGSHRTVPYFGPIETRFKNRVAYVGAIVMGDEVQLGAIPMEDMDLILMPNRRTADVNPLSPNVASARAK